MYTGIIRRKPESFVADDGRKVDYVATYLVDDAGEAHRLRTPAMTFRIGSRVSIEPIGRLDGKTDLVVISVELPAEPATQAPASRAKAS